MPWNDFVISDDKEKIQLERVCQLLGATYWEKGRPREVVEKSIANSMCFGIYLQNTQVGFARCVTDYATVYWLADVVVDSDYRHLGLGKALVEAIAAHKQLRTCFGILATQDAHRLYERYGFRLVKDRFMRKPAEQE